MDTRKGGETVYYRLEVVARLAGVSPRRAMRLARVGLLTPAHAVGDTELFGEREVARLRRIRRLTENLGVNLAGVEVILRLTDELAALRGASRDEEE